MPTYLMTSTTTAASDARKANGKNAQPLPLPSVLRDLAVLRASDIDLSSLVPAGSSTAATSARGPTHLEDSVDKSQAFIEEARKAIKIQDRGDVTVQGDKVELIRQELEEVDHGLQATH